MAAAAVDFSDHAGGMKKLNRFLATKSYISGFAPSQQDLSSFWSVGMEPCSKEYPHVARWWRHIASYSAEERRNWPGQKAVRPKAGAAAKAAPAPAAPAASAGGDDDDFDLFGEQTEEEKKQAEALKAKTAEAAAAKKATKKEVIEKSTLVIDVKPAGLHVDLDKLLDEIRKIEIDGVEWGQATKKVPLAFGLFKLQVGCVIIDKLVNTDDIVALIECIGLDEEQKKKKLAQRELGDVSDDEDDADDDEEGPALVASAEIVSFQKI